MQISRIAAGGVGVALVAAMTLGGAAMTASADDFYVDSLGEEGTSYPEGWFTGTITTPTEGTAEFSPYGLEIVGKMQILNGSPVATGLNQLANNTFFSYLGDAPTFQIPIFGNGATDQYFTTLRPAAPGYQNSTTQWITSGAIRNADNSGVAYAAGASATLDEFETALNAQIDVDFEILAYGYFWDNGQEGTLISSSYAGDTFWFYPQESVAVAPNPVSLTEYTTAGKGVTFTVSAYPESPVYLEVVLPNGTVLPVGEAFTDVNGVATVPFVGAAGSAAGAYTVNVYYGYEDEHNEVASASAAYTVALAATGSEGIDPALFIGASALLLAGAVLMIVRRRSAIASN